VTETISGYRLTSEFTTAGGGQSRWAFAERDGTQLFLKEFLSPKYPIDGAPGSAATKARKREECAAFEHHHRRLMSALAPLSAGGGNLVVATDFFRNGSRYYKVTEKIEVMTITAEEVAELPLDTRLLLMITVAHSLNVLHRAGLVHGDIKPPNILIKRLDGGGYGTKLIDFDNAVFAGEPLPPPEQLVGDMAYYSPELVEYLDTAGAGRLDTASDIFALGLVFAEWLTGRKPRFPADSVYAGVAVARGQRLDFGPIAPPSLAELLVSMVAAGPGARPAAAVVHAAVRAVRTHPDTAVHKPPAPPSAEGATTLRGSLTRKARATRTDDERAADPVRASTLRGSLVKKPPPS
jgi:eukaryotic-like serine/threonine-protein kinase